MKNYYDNDYNEQYSIVAGYQNNFGLFYYRLADYDDVTDCYYEVDYSTDVYGETIPCSLKASQVNMFPVELHKAVFKKCSYNLYKPSDSRVINNNSFVKKIYEIVYMDDDIENTDFSETIVRLKLRKGIYIPKETNSDFLLVVGKTKNKFVVLNCNIRQFKKKEENIYYVDCDTKDLKHATISFNANYIDFDSIISSRNLLDQSYAINVVGNVRYFYNQTKLPKSEDIVFVRTFEELSILYFTTFFKNRKNIYQLTTKDISKFKEVIHEVTKQEQEMKSFFALTGLDMQTSVDELNKVVTDVVVNLKKDSEYEEILKLFLLDDQELYDECLKSVREDWEKSETYISRKKELDDKLFNHEKSCNDKMIKLNNSVQEMNKKYDALVQEYKRKSEEVKNLDIKKSKVEIMIEELDSQRKVLRENMDTSLSEFKNDIVSLVKEIGIVEATFDITNKKDNAKMDHKTESSMVRELNTSNSYMKIKSKSLLDSPVVEMVKTTDYIEFYEGLVDNLTFKIPEDIAKDVAAGTLCALAQHKSLVVSEENAEFFAECISVLMNGYEPEKVYITSSDFKLENLFNDIKNAKSKVVYIDGLLNNYNESVAKILSKIIKNKIIVYSVDDVIVSQLSNSFWRFSAYIKLNQYYFHESMVETIAISNCKFDEVLNDIVYKSYKTSRTDVFKSFIKENLITNNVCDELSYMFRIYNVLLKTNVIPDFILNQILLSTNDKEKVLSFLKKSSEERIRKDSLICSIWSE